MFDETAFPIVASSLVTIPIAVYFSTRISSRILEVLLGAILVVLSVYFLFFGNKLRIKPNLANGMITGALGGVLGGLFSTNGPPIVLYLSSATKDKSVYFATTQFVFCISNIYSTITRAVNGIITWEILCFSAVGLIGCVLGDFVGKKVFDKLDSARLKQIIYIGMILSGIIMLI